jgi:hypothetical protein
MDILAVSVVFNNVRKTQNIPHLEGVTCSILYFLIKHIICIIFLFEFVKKGKGKVIPFQAGCGPESG